MLDMLVGIAGAFIGGMLILPPMGVTAISQNVLSADALLVPLVSVVILLVIVNLVRRNKAR